MSLSKMSQETIVIDSLSKEVPNIKKDFFRIREVNKQKRLTLYHIVVHILAFFILIPFLVMVLFQIKVPETYSTLVSVVVGFYFAKSLLDYR